MNVELEYLFLIVDKMVGRYLPARFVVFVAVGSLGLLIHLSILGIFHLFDAAAFSTGQMVATLSAMMFNFFLNNLVTFRDRRLKGIALLRGIVVFYAACSMGVLINLSFAHRLFVCGPALVLSRTFRRGHQLFLELRCKYDRDLAAHPGVLWVGTRRCASREACDYECSMTRISCPGWWRTRISCTQHRKWPHVRLSIRKGA